jgi:ribosome biogenesis GTPase A
VEPIDYNSLPLTGWYPGHMAKATRHINEDLKGADLVVEVCDARIPDSSRNPSFDKLFGHKARFVVFNKADLADPDATARWKAWYEAQGIRFEAISVGTDPSVLPALVRAWRRAAEAFREEHGLSRPGRSGLRVLVAGVPNVGKSTLINKLALKEKAKVGALPGVTRRTIWIAVPGGVELLDTPGVLWSRIRDKVHELRLALCGSIQDHVVGNELIAEFLWYELASLGLPARWDLYGLQACPETFEDLMEAVARRRGLIRSGGAIDLERSSTALVREWRAGNLGRFTLELPPEAGSPDPSHPDR